MRVLVVVVEAAACALLMLDEAARGDVVDVALSSDVTSTGVVAVTTIGVSFIVVVSSATCARARYNNERQQSLSWSVDNELTTNTDVGAAKCVAIRLRQRRRRGPL